MVVDLLNRNHNAPVVEIANYNIAPYDYQYRNQDDDFLPLVKQLLEFDKLVFATPVYWYAMSSQLKTFFDRLSDLVRVEKEVGRALAGRETYLVASGTEEELPSGFEKPFGLTSKYLDMTYCGAFYSYVKEDLVIDPAVEEAVSSFRDKLFGTV